MIKLSLVISNDNQNGVSASFNNESHDVTELERLMLAIERKNGFVGYLNTVKISLDSLADSMPLESK
jgi:hypothetical protein